MHQLDKMGENIVAAEKGRGVTTQSTTLSPRELALHHHVDDLANARAEGDTTTADALAAAMEVVTRGSRGIGLPRDDWPVRSLYAHYSHPCLLPKPQAILVGTKSRAAVSRSAVEAYLRTVAYFFASSLALAFR